MTTDDEPIVEAARDLARRLRAGELPAATDGGVGEQTRRAVAEARLDRVGTDLDLCLRVVSAVAGGCPLTAWHVAGEDSDVPDEIVQARIAAVLLGAGLGAADDFEAWLRARITQVAPAPPDDPESDYRRWLGTAMAELETARFILSAAARSDDATRLRSLSRQAARLAHGVLQDLLVHAAGSRPELGRIPGTAATVTVLWGHALGADDDRFSRQIARERLQLAGGAA